MVYLHQHSALAIASRKKRLNVPLGIAFKSHFANIKILIIYDFAMVEKNRRRK